MLETLLLFTSHTALFSCHSYACLSSCRPASEYSSPGRPLSCLVDENTPIMTPNGGAGVQGGDPRVQERRVRSQRHRNYMSRTHLHTPPDLPEGYGESHPEVKSFKVNLWNKHNGAHI